MGRGQNSVYIVPLTLQILTNIVLVQESIGLVQQALEIILSTVKGQFPPCLRDDVVIFSTYLEKHLKPFGLQTVLELLLGDRISLKLKKCLFDDFIDNLGHKIQPGSLDTSMEATNTSRILRNLASMAKFKSLQGLFNVFLRFVPNFTREAALSNFKLEKDQPSHF